MDHALAASMGRTDAGVLVHRVAGADRGVDGMDHRYPAGRLARVAARSTRLGPRVRGVYRAVLPPADPGVSGRPASAGRRFNDVHLSGMVADHLQHARLKAVSKHVPDGRFDQRAGVAVVVHYPPRSAPTRGRLRAIFFYC